MKRKLLLIASLVFVICCLFALTVNASQCQGGCTDNWSLTESDGGYLEPISATNTCSVCGTVIAQETVNPLFFTTGYSYNENDGGITQQFAADIEAISRYTEITGKSVLYGAIISTKNAIGNDIPLDSNGTPTKDGVFATNLSSQGVSVFDVMVNGIPEEHRLSTYLVCGAYVIIDGELSFIDNGKIEQSTSFNTYYDVVKSSSSWDDVKENEDGRTFKVLTIGNSFSDDALEYVYKIAKEAGIEHVELANLRASNCSLATHLSNATGNKGVYMFRHWADGATTWADTGTWSGGPYTIKQAVEFTDWDYIVFQQVSSDSGKASTYDDLSALISYVEALNPTAKFAWHMTWSMRADYASSGPAYKDIVNAVNEKITSNKKIDVVIPSGTAIENAKTSYLTNVQIQRDAKHLAYGMGRYIAGLTFVKALTGLSIDQTSYPLTDTEGHSSTSGSNENWKSSFRFTDEINAICIESANNAIETPYAVTNSEYPTQNN